MKKVLIIRNDKLGDFMLAYPSFALAKENLPDTEIHALVPDYTKVMAETCQWIDKVIIDPGKDAGILKNIDLLRRIKQQQYDAVITLFSTSRIGLLTKLAGIPYRLAPATKIAQVFYNHKLVQRRSRSEKPEYAYNMDLVFQFLGQHGIEGIQEQDSPYLAFPQNKISTLRQGFIQQHNIPANHKLVFLHPGSGGSASNLTPKQFSLLASKLRSQSGHTVIITAGPGELETARLVAKNLPDTATFIYESNQGLIDFSQHIQFADLFISGSTGTLHIAGALDTPTAGFYPLRRSATPLRWQTLNSPHKRLAFTPNENAEQEDMSTIDLENAAQKISEQFLQ